MKRGSDRWRFLGISPPKSPLSYHTVLPPNKAGDEASRRNTEHLRVDKGDEIRGKMLKSLLRRAFFQCVNIIGINMLVHVGWAKHAQSQFIRIARRLYSV